LAIWALAAAAGVAAALVASEPAFAALKLGGAAYLVWARRHGVGGRVRRALNAVTGLSLVAFGVRLAAGGRPPA
jgi:threonine/homoserine/homoserine lactone efflux protein